MALAAMAASNALQQAAPGVLLALPAALQRLRHILQLHKHAAVGPAGVSAGDHTHLHSTWSTHANRWQGHRQHQAQQGRQQQQWEWEQQPSLDQQAFKRTTGWHPGTTTPSTWSTAPLTQQQPHSSSVLQPCQRSPAASTYAAHRHYSAAADTDGQLPPGGPAREKQRAVPFLVSKRDAEEAFRAYHSQGMLVSRQAPAAQAAKEAYLPFWLGSAHVRTRLSSAEVGNDVLVNRYNPATRRLEPMWETTWQRVQLDMGWEQEYSPESPDMQLYASWKYPRGDIQPLRPGEHVSVAGPITPNTMDASDGSGTRKVGPFHMTPDVARRLLKGKVETAERRTAEATVLQATGAKHIRFLQMEMDFVGGTDGPTLSPIYVPAYVFSWRHAGVKVRTFVSGVDASHVSGSQVLDETKVATTVTSVVTGGLFWSGAIIVLGVTRFFWLAFVLPLAVSWAVARFWPVLRSWYQGATSSAQAAWQQRGSAPEAEAEWDAEFVKGYERYEHTRRQQQERQQQQQQQQQWQQGGSPFGFEDFQEAMRDPMGWFGRRTRQQQQRQEQQGWQQQAGGGYQRQQQQQQRGGYQQQWQQRQQQQAPRGPPGDPLGFYQTLGVGRGATTAEIQSAFRGKALKHHPDRYTGEADKKAATARFQKITEAFQVLRDKNKRQQYDAGIYNG